MCKCNFKAKLISIKCLLLKIFSLENKYFIQNPICVYEPDIRYCSSVAKFLCQNNKLDVSLWLFEELSMIYLNLYMNYCGCYSKIIILVSNHSGFDVSE